MRSNLVKRLVSLDAIAIESPSTGIGISDVNLIGGWMECKWLRRWPRGADKNPVRFPHPLSKEQGIFLWRHCKKGGVAMCVVQVSREWFFFDGLRIRELWGNMTRPQMIEEAALYFPNGLQTALLLEFWTARYRASAMRNDW